MSRIETVPSDDSKDKIIKRLHVDKVKLLVDGTRLYRTLLNIDATARRWAVAAGGDTPLAMIAEMARKGLNMTAEQVDAEVSRIQTENNQS